MFRRTAEQKTAAAVRAEHNRRFNNSDTDPGSPEYLASHDAVVTAERAAKESRKRG